MDSLGSIQSSAALAIPGLGRHNWELRRSDRRSLDWAAKRASEKLFPSFANNFQPGIPREKQRGDARKIRNV